MKKLMKIFLWSAVVILVIGLVTALSMKPEIDTSGKDLFLYKMSGISLLLIWLFGLLAELNVFHIKKKIPLVKSNYVGQHIIFWIILIIVSFVVFGIFYNSTSPEFKEAMTETDTNETDSVDITETKPITVEDVAESTEESADMKYGDNTSTYESSSLENQADSEEEENPDTASGLIEDETYSFDDATFVVNGIELTVNSITLHREYKPEGYSLEVAYSLQNQNDTDATFEFSSESGNVLILEEQKARMAKQATYSNEHCTEYHLKANEKTESFIGDFYALSSSSGKTINGESFEAVDISNLYAGQNITIKFQVNGICNDETETMVLSFEIVL